MSLNAATLVRYQSSSQAGLWIYTSWLNAIYSSTPRDPGVNDYMVFSHDVYTLKSSPKDECGLIFLNCGW